MVAGVLAVFVLIFAGYHVIKDATRKRNTRNIVNVAGDQPVNEKWELGSLYNIDGTQFVACSCRMLVRNEPHRSRCFFQQRKLSLYTKLAIP
jgi:hypothetical protein